MGDILSLIEKAESVYEEAEAEVAAQKLMEGQFTFDDFLDQMAQIKKMGSISSLLGMMPGIPKEMKNVNIDDTELNRIEGMNTPRTRAERNYPTTIKGYRRARMAQSSGTAVGKVSTLVKQVLELQTM